MQGVLRLEARDADDDLARWDWVLTDASGALVAHHKVRVDKHSWQYGAFADLRHYISWHAAPDLYAEDEARIVADVGEWMGLEVFGPVADALVKAAKKTPVTVRVVVPENAKALMFRPLELTHVGGRPLAAQNVTLVMQSVGDSRGDAVQVGGRLRILGLFSLPEGGQALNLRRERHALVQLINRIAKHGKAAEVRALQYGVTRERLQSVLKETEGWDIIHISGHGAPGELLLEARAGAPDKVTAAELADLLEPARGHVKLVTVAACWSAAIAAEQQRRLLGLPVLNKHSLERAGGDSFPPGSFATELIERLGCAVFAMRYPVADEFAFELSEKLYALLIAEGQPLARAVGMTIKELTAGNRFPALSAATPALFGQCAAELTLAAPRRTEPPSYETGEPKLAGLLPQREHFVGRTRVMARSSAVLADESGIPGVLLHGMPGGGKTACALELAYTHEHAFDRLAWYTAPEEGMEIGGALTDFALAMEYHLDGFQMAYLVDDADKLAAFLPAFTELMERNRILIVVDNAESLLTDGGQWHDNRWGQVISALTAHHGLGRVIVTSRRLTRETSGFRVETVGALSADEALLLARELPHLSDLLYGNLPNIDQDTARKLARAVLNVAQGNPMLLELANKQATNPQLLAELVTVGDQAWRKQGGLPDGFFATGETRAEPGDFLHVLAAWTNAVTGTLTPAERDLFWFVCCLEEPDRERTVADNNWADVWQRLDRSGQPPALNQSLAAIASRGLVTVQAKTDDRDESYAIHPAVSAAGRDRAGAYFRHVVATLAAEYWDTACRHAYGAIGESVDTSLIVRAGLAAVRYLSYQKEKDWTTVGETLEHVFLENPSKRTAVSLLPVIKQIIKHDPRHTNLLAKVVMEVDPVAAQAQMHTNLESALGSGNYRAAAIAAGQLTGYYRRSLRLAEALDLAEQALSYTRNAGLGPWTELLAEGERLQVLIAMGKHRQVLEEVHQILDRAKRTLADPSGKKEATTPWNASQMLLGSGRSAALHLGNWSEALEFNAKIIDIMHFCHAPADEIARARFSDYGPMISLGRIDEALSLLLDCRQVFQHLGDTRSLGMTLSALAHIEDLRGHRDAACRLMRDGLRYNYLARDMASTAAMYNNLGTLHYRARQPTAALACHLAADLISILTNSLKSGGLLHGSALDLAVFGTDAEPPTDVADLCRKIGNIPGTDPADLIARIADPETAERTLQDLIATAGELAEAQLGDLAPE